MTYLASKHIEISEFERVTVLPDIHATVTPLRQILEKSKSHTRENPVDGKHALVSLGDIAGKGMQLPDVIDLLYECRNIYDAVIPIMGNHDAALLKLLNTRPRENNSSVQFGSNYRWILRGQGWAAISAYVEGFLNEKEKAELMQLAKLEVFMRRDTLARAVVKKVLSHEARSALRQAMRQRGHLQLFEEMVISALYDNIGLSHAGGYPQIPIRHQSPEVVMGLLDESMLYQLQEKHEKPFADCAVRMNGHLEHFDEHGDHVVILNRRVVRLDVNMSRKGSPTASILNKGGVIEFLRPFKPVERFKIKDRGLKRIGAAPNAPFVKML